MKMSFLVRNGCGADSATLPAVPANDMTYPEQGFRLRLTINVGDAKCLFTVMYVRTQRRLGYTERSN